jgi:hypothetical protein
MVWGKNFSFEHNAGGAIGFLASFVLHLALLIAMACSVFRASFHTQRVLVTAEVGQSSEIVPELVPTIEMPGELAESLSSDPAMPKVELELNPQINLVSASKKVVSDIAIHSTIASDSTYGSGDGGGDDRGQSAASGNSDGDGAAFFGSYASGNRFVYVLDSSRSMLEDDRWTYACNQLIDSLNGLRSDQEFFVICFDAKTSLLFNTLPAKLRYVQPNDDNVPRVRRWLRNRELGKATMPAEALQVALTLRPDAIFLLSDGELQDNTMAMLRMVNGFSPNYRQIPIHTIHLFSAQGRQTLEQLARENAGSFTPVQK